MARTHKAPTPAERKKGAMLGILAAIVFIVVVSVAVAITRNTNTQPADEGNGNVTDDRVDPADGTPLFVNPVTGERMDSAPLDIHVIDAIPQNYDDQAVCIDGFYQSSFEFAAIGPDFRVDDNGDSVINKPWIWASGFSLDDVEGVTCRRTDAGQQTCFGEVVVCGTLHYAPEGEKGFGHVNAYRYEIVP